MCCLFGFLDLQGRLGAKQKNRLTAALASAAEERGTDATGVAYNSGGELCIHKLPLPGHLMRWRIPGDSAAVMGHTRMATQGSARKNRNNHPWLGQAGATPFSLAHNGVLWNDRELRRELALPGTKIETDSFVAVQLLEQYGELSPDALRYMAEQLRGSFTFTLLDHRDTLYILRGDSPFCLRWFPKRQLYVYASTREILERALAQTGLAGGEELPLACGEIWQLRRDGSRQKDRFNDIHLLMDSYPPWRSWRQRDDGLQALRSAAPLFGFTQRSIDRLLEQGFTPEEIEELLFCGTD